MDLTDRSATNPARPVARKFGVNSIPDVRILSPEGREVGMVDSADVEDLIVQLKQQAG